VPGERSGGCASSMAGVGTAAVSRCGGHMVRKTVTEYSCSGSTVGIHYVMEDCYVLTQNPSADSR